MPEKEFPLVSIVIPVYNSQDFITETLNSALCQTYTNIEIICVDDGSTDQTVSIVKRIMEKDARLHLYIREELPKGGSTCRNIGAYQSGGKYLMFLDSDDVLSHDCVENRLNAIRNTDNKFVVFPMASFKDDISTWKMTSRLHVRDFKHFFASGFAAWQVSSTFFDKEFFTCTLKGFDNTFQRLQDIEMHLRAILASNDKFTVFKDAQPDCFYRRSESPAVSHRKMVITLQAYEHFSELLLTLYEKGTFKSKHLFSLSILIMLLTMLCTVNILYMAHIYEYDRARIYSIALKKKLTWYHKPLFIFGIILTSPKLGMLYARVMRRICQNRFY